MPAASTAGLVIAVALVGGGRADDIAGLVPALAAAFGGEVRVVEPVPLPPSAYDPARGQHLATALLDALARAPRDGREILLGVAEVDLYVPELNFVFGVGDPRRRLAVISLARLRSPDAPLERRRIATEAIHEIGHALGLAHCHDPACVMWFSNTLAESDRKGTRFCARHAAEIARAARPAGR